MSILDEIKQVIKMNYKDATGGIYNCRNTVFDRMTTLYLDDSGVQVDICYDYEYFEVFGLSDKEFTELVEYYNAMSI